MRVLILGGDGMFGHQAFSYLREAHEVKATLRSDVSAYNSFGLFTPKNSFGGIDVRNFDRVVEVVANFKPDAVINGIGIVKQQDSAKQSLPSLEINALFPHKLALLCRASGSRVIHLSTDCVFLGDKGGYRESDIPDASDLYGRSKLLGEVQDDHCLTLRTSIIGWELLRKKSLMEWFVAQSGRVKGYRNAIFSGFTTLELTRIIERCLVHYPNLSGLYHVSSEAIDKFELLSKVKQRLKLKTEIVEQSEFHCDRSLNSSRFRADFHYMPPVWDDMINELCEAREGGQYVS